MSDRRTATSFSFSFSIPRSWTVSEVLRVAESLRDDEEFRAMSPAKKAEATVAELLSDNPEVQLRWAYGLTAVTLLHFGCLKQARSLVCTLIKAPGESDDDPEVISNNHRFFEVDSEIVDPVTRHHEKLGGELRRREIFIINSYPYNIAHGVLERAKGTGRPTTDNLHTIDSPERAWFVQAIRRLARRTNLTPDWWSRKDRRGIKDRRGFEGYIRALVPHMSGEYGEAWTEHLQAALSIVFPSWPEASLSNFMQRIVEEFGPAPPRSHHESPRKIRMVQPTSLLSPSNSSGYNT